MTAPSVPCAGGVTMVKVSESPSASLPLRCTVTAWSSLVEALAGFATGGVLQVTNGGVPTGSEGADGEQTPVCVSGKTLVAVPMTGNEVPVVLIVPHAVRMIVPWSTGTRPELEPTGRTSPVPFVQTTLPE